MNPYLKQYKQTQINTTPKEQILLMLYDGAVRFLHQAKEGFAEKNIEKIHNNIVKTQNIITEFQVNLDVKTGGEFAQNLFNLYEFLTRQLLIANVKKDEAALDLVIRHVTELRDTWREAVKKFKAEGHSLDSNVYDNYSVSGQQSTFSVSDTEDEDEEDEDLGEYI